MIGDLPKNASITGNNTSSKHYPPRTSATPD